MRDELLVRYSGQVPRGPDRPSDRRAMGPQGPMGPLGTHPFSDEGIRERAERGELQLGGESFGPSSGTFFEGPDMRDPEVRATVAYMTSTFKIHPLDPEAPDMWVDNVSDALFSSGMSAIYLAADCREKSEVPVRTRIGVELIPLWKQAFAWTVVRRSLQSVQAIYNRTKRCPKGDLEGLVRMVLEYVQKRTQGVETRLRDEVAAAQLVNYPSLKAYISDLETKFNKLMTNGVTITDSEQRHLLLRGLTPEYHGVKASILTYRNRYNRPADFTETVAMLEDFEDNTMQVTSRTFTNNRPLSPMLPGCYISSAPSWQSCEPGPIETSAVGWTMQHSVPSPVLCLPYPSIASQRELVPSFEARPAQDIDPKPRDYADSSQQDWPS